ncbi:MAG TPA: fumarylacetoacetate hydrolase family protein [Alphaproteobacteria bacterium]|nr:fumarylacetoacetate hydrolase family protein [Alphaproteobacteria bacterium]
MAYLFEPESTPSVEIKGRAERFPVHRIYCVARNYAAHAREMGMNPDREPPFFFSKPADAIVPNGGDVPYPPRTANLHHEIELVVALGKGGANIPEAEANGVIFGYAVGNDLTRRDLQFEARDKGRPWDTAKGFDHAAPVTSIYPVASTGILEQGRIWLSVNGIIRQNADLAEMIWPVPAIIAELSTLYELRRGDLIFTGTPAGVGPVVPGDRLEGGIEGLDTLINQIIA